MTKTPGGPTDPRDHAETDDARTHADESRTDAAIRDLNSRILWPQPQSSASPATSERPPTINVLETAHAASTSRKATLMRKLGVGMVGLIGGLLLGLLARFIVPGDPPLLLALVLGAVTLTLAVAGVVGALAIDHYYLKRRAQSPPTKQP